VFAIALSRRLVVGILGVALFLATTGCGGRPSTQIASPVPSVRTDPASVFVAVEGVTFVDAPASTVAGIAQDLGSQLPRGSLAGIDARSAIITPQRTAQVTVLATTAGYATYPTFFPLVLRLLGSGEQPSDGINTFDDATLRTHLTWRDGHVIVDVASLDEATAALVASALHEGQGSPVPKRVLPAVDPQAVLAPVPGYRYREVPFHDRGDYLRSMRLVEAAVAQSIAGYALREVAAEGSPEEDPPLAVVLAVSMDPQFVAWRISGSAAAVILHTGGGTAKNQIRAQAYTTRIGTTADGRTVIAWLQGTVAILVTSADATIAPPVLVALGAPGY
jgi:hypothetical protein